MHGGVFIEREISKPQRIFKHGDVPARKDSWWECMCSKPNVDDLFASSAQALKELHKKLVQERDQRENQANQRQPETKIKVGDMVLVHHTRMPSSARTKTQPAWFGPFLVKSMQGRVAQVQVDKNEIRVDCSQLKKWTSTSSSATQVPVLSPG